MHHRFRIGIDLGGTKIETIAIAANGETLLRQRVPTPSGNYDATLAAVVGLVAGIEQSLGSRGSVGIGIPGAVSPASGLIKNANSTWLIGRPFAADLEKALGQPVRLANDADCFALSEASDGAAQGLPVVFGVILGTGVGGGIVIGGQLLAGPNAIAGEWGHNPLPWPEDSERPGPACYCGRCGCIETFLSGPGLSLDDGQQRPASTIATASDALALASLRRYETRLARALAHVINILDPHAIVLGGGLSQINRLYQSIPQLWSRWVFSDHVDTKLLPPRHGDSSGVRGAAWLWPA